MVEKHEKMHPKAKKAQFLIFLWKTSDSCDCMPLRIACVLPPWISKFQDSKMPSATHLEMLQNNDEQKKVHKGKRKALALTLAKL